MQNKRSRPPGELRLNRGPITFSRDRQGNSVQRTNCRSIPTSFLFLNSPTLVIELFQILLQSVQLACPWTDPFPVPDLRLTSFTAARQQNSGGCLNITTGPALHNWLVSGLGFLSSSRSGFCRSFGNVFRCSLVSVQRSLFHGRHDSANLTSHDSSTAGSTLL